jgi:hypothetical protein
MRAAQLQARELLFTPVPSRPAASGAVDAVGSGVWLTGTLLGYWRPAPILIAVAPVIITAATLTAVLLVVEIGRLLIRPPAGSALGRGSTSTV